MKICFTLAAAAALLAAAAALAQHTDHKMNMTAPMADTIQEAKIMVVSPWARASIGKNGAAYFTIVNSGRTDDKLIGVMADVAKRVELHTHKMDGNVMRMRPIETIPVPSRATVTLQPGGNHVMLMGLNRKLTEGKSFLLTLVFDKAGKVEVSVRIGKMGAAGPIGGMPHMHDSGHPNMPH